MLPRAATKAGPPFFEERRGGNAARLRFESGAADSRRVTRLSFLPAPKYCTGS